MINLKCKRCNRELKSKESQERGYGKTCYRIVNLSKQEKPIDDITFLKMEINMLKKMLRNLTKNGIKAIERIKNDSPKRNEQVSQFNECVRELKGIFNCEQWDYRNVLVPINPRETIENPPIAQII